MKTLIEILKREEQRKLNDAEFYRKRNLGRFSAQCEHDAFLFRQIRRMAERLRREE